MPPKFSSYLVGQARRENPGKIFLTRAINCKQLLVNLPKPGPFGRRKSNFPSSSKRFRRYRVVSMVGRGTRCVWKLLETSLTSGKQFLKNRRRVRRFHRPNFSPGNCSPPTALTATRHSAASPFNQRTFPLPAQTTSNPIKQKCLLRSRQKNKFNRDPCCNEYH